MTSKQRNYIAFLADKANYMDVEQAIQAATGWKRSKQQKRGVSAAQASATIDMLKAQI